jgi:hypothetical protein
MIRAVGTPLTEEEIAVAVEAYQEHTRNGRAAARALDIPYTNFRRRINAAAERGLLGYDPVLPGFHLKEVSQLTGPEGVEKAWVKQAKEPGEPFEMPDGQVLRGISALVTGDGRLLQKWVKTKTDDITTDLVEALKSVFASYQGYAPLIPPPSVTDTDLLSVYPIADQHNGLLAWGRETGESYDLKIGEERLRSCMARLVAQSPSSQHAIILNLGDWQHTNDDKNMTPGHGNILDADSRYFKILTAGVILMQDCIELALQKHGQVMVVNVPGNHDPHASIALTLSLSSFYRNNPRVRIHDQPADYFFHRFGNTLIGATHGHRTKPADMAMAMAVRCRSDWGLTKYHVMYYGHIHHETVKEVGDVRVESFQTLAANDAWHHAGGYCSGKSITSITFHRDDGEIGRHRVNVPAPDRHASMLQEAA